MSLTTTTAILMTIMLCSSWAVVEGQIIRTADVTVTNLLYRHHYLTMHCKSKDDDLGVRVLPKRGSWSWHFVPNFWGTTLFFCAFKWDTSNGLHWFDIYVQKRDQDRCSDCRWIVTQRGPCWYNATSGGYTVCYPFNNNLARLG
ncbi:unnamed protein product [Linum tenue]|uniref:S-protein homolog n=1 Tax=Linum tenue TaxID=586396 RepID=A0AAV0PP02_9ROSI|nr:unnamed protein product [Linum tenue]